MTDFDVLGDWVGQASSTRRMPVCKLMKLQKNQTHGMKKKEREVKLLQKRNDNKKKKWYIIYTASPNRASAEA